MIKLCGFFCLILSTTLAGFSFAKNIEERYSQQKLSLKMLDEIEIYLEYGVMTKDEIFTRIYENHSYDILREERLNETSLIQTEKSRLFEFYKSFGKTDLQGQLKYLEMVRAFFKESNAELKEIKNNKCRLYRTAGILSGIMVSLLLV